MLNYIISMFEHYPESELRPIRAAIAVERNSSRRSAQMSDQFLAEVRMFSMNFAPVQ